MSDLHAGGPPASVEARITRLILDKLREGVAPWRQSWRLNLEPPRPLGRRRPYRRWNRWVLSLAAYACPCWVTAEEAKRRAWRPRAGEEPLPVWGLFPDRRKHCRDREWRISVCWVYNLSQLEGVPERLLRRLTPPAPERRGASSEAHAQALARAEAVLAGMPRAPAIRAAAADHAAYSPRLDLVSMPPRETFESEDGYHATLFHELVHSTGHRTRLCRRRWPHGDQQLHDLVRDYAYEELVAELGAAMLCDELGLAPELLDSSAAYVQGWLRALEAEPEAVPHAAREADAATSYVLGRSKLARDHGWEAARPSDARIKEALDLIESLGGVDALFGRS